MSNVITITRTPKPTDTALTPFSFGLIDVRVTTRNGEPWFVLADVCRVLEIANPSQAASRLDEDERGICQTETPSGIQNMVIISEAGLYRLVMRSDKPQARRFQKWVTSEVLPMIRKTGSYGQPKDTLTALNDPAALRGLLLTYSEKVIALQGDVAKDVAERLGYVNPNKSVEDHCKGVTKRYPLQTSGGLQQVRVINRKRGKSPGGTPRQAGRKRPRT